VATTTDDYLAMQLKSAEGQGLSDSDVSRSTKVTLRIPHNEHQLAEFIGAFSLLLSLLFGPSAPIHLAVQGWISHIQDHQTVYAQLMRADIGFGCRLLALIDRAIQLYFRACLDPNRQPGAERLLQFDSYQAQIIMHTFSYPVLPAAIARLLQLATVASPGLTNPSHHQPHSSPSDSVRHVFNPDRLPSFRATPDIVSILQNRIASSPKWTGRSNTSCHPCPRYHSGGECTTDCPRAATHRPPKDTEIGPYVEWMTSKIREAKASPKSSSNPLGNPSSSQQRRQAGTDPHTSSSSKRRRPSSPRAPGNSTRSVKFAKDDAADTGQGPDF
jgi:hypothetical protein